MPYSHSYLQSLEMSEAIFTDQQAQGGQNVAVYKRLRSKNTHRMNVKIWKKIFLVNGNKNKAGIAILCQTKQTLKNQRVQSRKII